MELGIIEGFYGRPWSWPERSATVVALAAHGFRTHLYAPKADITLRGQWRSPIPAQWRAQVLAHQQICQRHRVKFGLGFSPEAYDPNNDDDQRQFAARLGELNSLNLDSLAILFDDPVDRTSLQPLVQAALVNQTRQLSTAGDIYVCPTWYSSDPLLDRIYGQRPPNYLVDLCQGLDASVLVFWAGEQICARGYGTQELERVAQQMRRAPVLWDNYPVNDGPMMSPHLHLRPPAGRTPSVLSASIRGHFVNPALQPVLTQVAAVALANNYRQYAAQAHDIDDLQSRFMAAATAVLSAPLARQVWQDLSLLQDAGLHQLGANKARLLAIYEQFEHPGAREIVAWLNGHWTDDRLVVDTQT